jgi:formate dehydrogenase (coenzyme F420) beta subunit
MYTMIPIDNGDVLTGVRKFLGQLLENGIVDALFLPLEVDGGAILPSLVTDPQRLEQANPLAPVMPINAARAVGALTGKHAPERLGAVLRPCEIRALIELVKLQQASLEDVLLIGIDCPGTYELSDYVEKKRLGEISLDEVFDAAVGEGEIPTVDGLSPRPACQMCTQPVPEHTAIHLQIFGMDPVEGLPVEMDDAFGSRVEGLAEANGAATNRTNLIEPLLARRSQKREQEIEAMQQQMGSNGGMSGLFATCIRCHNCMTACPICYCKTCLFRTAAFDHKPEHYYSAAHRKGALRMLDDTLLFHMTRLNHMSTSCVSCGMCTSACPSNIPVGMIFSVVGTQVQSVFDYLPGRDVTEPLPLITFQANEWTEIGESQ